MNGNSTHTALATLTYKDCVLQWGRRNVTDIAEEVGRTPFYAYDSERMTRRVAELRTAMPSQLHIHYAMKANPLPAVVRHMAGLVDGLDVASTGELHSALEAAVNPKNISFAGPGKRRDEISAAINAGVTINMESEGEMSTIADLATKLGQRPNVAIRVNPAFELKSAGMKMGGRPSPFGVDAEQVPEMLERLSGLDLDFRGFHVYSGSQNLRASAIDESMANTVDLIIDLAGKTDLAVQSVNLGGGLGIPYFPNEKPLDLTIVGDSVDHAIKRLSETFGALEVVLELGRYLVGESGIYVCRVLNVKRSRGTTYAVCDGGLHHHLAASGNFGQVIRKNYPIANVERHGDHTENITVVGPLCTPLDLLANRVDLAPIEVGSMLAICQSGAYGLSASPTRFLSHPACSEILV